MNKIKVIDLLNMISKGEEVPKKIRIDHWCYKFEWVEHNSNYYDKHEDIDLMSCLSMDKEELNYEVHEIEEEKIQDKQYDSVYKSRNEKAIEYINNDLLISVLPNNQIINGNEVVKRINYIEKLLNGDE